MAVNDTVRLDVIGTVAGQRHIHTLHFRYQEVTSTDQGLIDSWQTVGRTSYRGCFGTADKPVELLRAVPVCGSVPLRAATEEAEITANQAGTIAWAGERAPSWLAAVVSWRTGTAGASYRGRNFFGGLWEGGIVGNDLETGTKGNYQTYVNALAAAYYVGGTVSGYKLVVYSRKQASVPGTQCQDSSHLISSSIVNSALGSMKSRKVGSGL